MTEKIEKIALSSKAMEHFLEDMKIFGNTVNEKFEIQQKKLTSHKKNNILSFKFKSLLTSFLYGGVIYGLYYEKYIRPFPFVFQMFWFYVFYRFIKKAFIDASENNNSVNFLNNNLYLI